MASVVEMADMNSRLINSVQEKRNLDENEVLTDNSVPRVTV